MGTSTVYEEWDIYLFIIFTTAKIFEYRCFHFFYRTLYILNENEIYSFPDNKG